MSNNQGWIKLHRSMIDWEWFTDVNVTHLFHYCLLKANHQDKKWRGIDVKRGQFVTSLDKISKETGLSVRQIRTALDKLKMTSEVTSKSTNKNRLITITNYDFYQCDDKQSVNKKASKRQTNDKQATTNKNGKNGKNDKNICLKPPDADLEIWQEFINHRKNRKSLVTSRVVQNIITQSEKAGIHIDEALQECIDRNWLTFKSEWYFNSKGQKNGDRHNNNQTRVHDDFSRGAMLALEELNKQG